MYRLPCRVLVLCLLLVLLPAPASAFQRQDAGRPGGEAREATRPALHTALFLAGPVRNNEDLARLRDTLRRVEGVREVEFRSADPNNRARILVRSASPLRLEPLLQAARNAGFTLEKIEEGRDDPVEQVTLAAWPVRTDGDVVRLQRALSRVDGARVIGVRTGEGSASAVVSLLIQDRAQIPALIHAGRRAGFQVRLLDGPGGSPGGGPGRPGVPRPSPSPRLVSALYLAGPVRNNDDLARLRGALTKVEGVRDVIGRTPDPNNRAQVEVRSAAPVRYELLLQAARNAGFTLDKVQ